MTNNIQVAAYYFPNYHPDQRNHEKHGVGWTEWELVRRATPRFSGHQQPKVPLWGYEDESDPLVMARKIETAASHGLSAFIFDWYWYNDGPYLERALEHGFLRARNADKLKFAVMWANHDWVDIHPAVRNRPYNLFYPGKVTEDTFIRATDHMITYYFSHPSYWRVDGGLYFSVYELMNLIEGLGGIRETKRVLKEFRDRVRKAGHGELHLNAIVWGVQNLPNELAMDNPNQLLETLGFDSATSYVWIHHHPIQQFPSTLYAEYRSLNLPDFTRFDAEFNVPYYPNVTVGWDPSPRTIQSDAYDNLGYPYTPVLVENSPEAFRQALVYARDFMQTKAPNQRILTINAWNEWTEGSYLEPDTIYGMEYLEAIRSVFRTTARVNEA